MAGSSCQKAEAGWLSATIAATLYLTGMFLPSDGMKTPPVVTDEPSFRPSCFAVWCVTATSITGKPWGPLSGAGASRFPASTRR